MAEDKNNKDQNEFPLDKPSIYAMNEKVLPISLEEEMKNSYIDYAMSVIVGRALPDAKDGLKPVHRRILFAMEDLGLSHNKPYKKSARIVGEVLGKYHPHGDAAVYESLVRMVQLFSLRYPLVDGQGNFGSVDGDGAAAMRYTEARMSSIAGAMLEDIEKDTVEWGPNFDESLKEPNLLPAKLPNLLVNGSSGIAVGMATNIPPHNLTEVVNAVAALIDEPEITIKELMKHVKGPDFPTGGLICGREGIKEAYETGKGRAIVRAKAFIEEQKAGKEAIIVKEIPYMVNKTNVIESIVNLVDNKKIEGISDLRDESDRDGMRLVIELKRDANANVVLNQLYKHTQLQDTFSINMLALLDGQPKVLNLKEALQAYIDHRSDVVMRRTKYELDKAQKRAHILEGLKKAVANLDKVIKIIRAAKSPAEAGEQLMKEFKLSEIQTKAILEMQLQRLTALERQKIDDEYVELLKRIEYYESILKSRKKVLSIVKEEALELLKKHGDERRTQIVAAEADVDIEDLITEEDVLISISYRGYIKRIPVSQYRKQHRGGQGVSGADMQEEDFIKQLFLASTHDTILFFTNLGRVFAKRAFEIPQASRIAKGKAMINLLQLGQNEVVTSCLQVKEFDDKHYLVMVTSHGTIKKTILSAYAKPRQTGIQAISLRDGDGLIDCMITDGNNEILIASKNGKAIRFNEEDAREMGRTASGVRGISLDKKDQVVAALKLEPKSAILTISSGGFGKRSKVEDYRLQTRGGKGVINVKATEKTGHVVDVLNVYDDDEIILMTNKGQVVRTPVNSIRVCGRNTQGVRAMRLKPGQIVASATKVVAKDEEE